LTDTAFLRSDELSARTALGYVEVDGAWTNLFHLPVRGSGDGGIYSTAADISSFWQAFSAGRIVSTEWVAEMVRPRSDVPAQSMRYGLGFCRRRHPGGLRRWSLFPFRVRPGHAGDSHGDFEHGWGRLADRPVSRECDVKLSDFPRKSARAGSGG
jgi:CubicO group peptidase (beta-lactamase class C family)